MLEISKGDTVYVTGEGNCDVVSIDDGCYIVRNSEGVIFMPRIEYIEGAQEELF